MPKARMYKYFLEAERISSINLLQVTFLKLGGSPGSWMLNIFTSDGLEFNLGPDGPNTTWTDLADAQTAFDLWTNLIESAA